MNDILQLVGYSVLFASVLGILYVFYKILWGFFKAFMKNDD